MSISKRIIVIERTISILGSFTLGALLVFFAYVILTSIPQKSELNWAHSSDIVEVKHYKALAGGRNFSLIPHMCLITQDHRSLYLNSEDNGFSELYTATQNGVNYSVGFTQERMLFSDSPKLYSIVKVIIVDGVPVRSYENYVIVARIFSGILFGFGILLVGYALNALRTKLLANPAFKRDSPRSGRAP
jgi:hypothetical protein